MPGLQLDDLLTDLHLIQTGKFRAAWIVGHESCSLNIICLRSMRIEAHDFMPDLKVDRFMPVVINHTILMFYRQIMESIDRTEADLNIIYRIWWFL